MDYKCLEFVIQGRENKMGKTIRYGEKSGDSFRKQAKKYPELFSPRVFYNKLNQKRSKLLAKKRRTTYK